MTVLKNCTGNREKIPYLSPDALVTQIEVENCVAVSPGGIEDWDEEDWSDD